MMSLVEQPFLYVIGGVEKSIWLKSLQYSRNIRISEKLGVHDVKSCLFLYTESC